MRIGIVKNLSIKDKVATFVYHGKLEFGDKIVNNKGESYIVNYILDESNGNYKVEVK